MSGGGEKFRVVGSVQHDLDVANEWIQYLTQDAFSRYQIWSTMPDSVLRLGADTADGDAFNADSEGIVVYKTSDNELGRMKADRFGLTRASDSSLYYFRVDQSALFYRDDPPGGAIHFYVNRTTGWVGIGSDTPVGTELLRVVGDARIEGKLTVTGLIDPTGLVVDEQATVPGGAPGAAKGTFWIKDDSPNRPYFTDDAGTDHDLLSASAGPWDETGGVVSTDNVGWDVVVGAAAMSGVNSEKFRVVGDCSFSDDIFFETESGGTHYIRTNPSPAGVNVDGDELQIWAGSADGATGSTAQAGDGGRIRLLPGSGGKTTSTTHNGGQGGRFDFVAGSGGLQDGTGAATPYRGGQGGNATLRGGPGGSASASGDADGGPGGEAALRGGQGGNTFVGNTTGNAGDGGPTYVEGGDAGTALGAGNDGDGGDAYIRGGGIGAGSGTKGKVIVADQDTSATEIGNATDDPPTDFLGVGVVTFNSLARVDPSDGGSIWGALSRDGSALVQIDTTTKGFLPPRMTRDQRNLIAAPATGLEVHDTSRSGSLDFYDGNQWREVAPYIDAGVVAGGGSYSAAIDELIRVASAIGSPTTVTLPTAVGCAMRAITVKETAGNAGTININTTGGQSIDGTVGPPADTWATAYGAATYISDGANWMKFV
jgi:hypothetical protein